MLGFAIVIFILFSGAGWLVLYLQTRGAQRKLADRIDSVLIPVSEYNTVHERATSVDSGGRLPFARIDRATKHLQFHRRIGQELRKANLNLKISEFLTIVLLCATVSALLAHLLTHRSSMTVIALVAGALAPVLTVKRRQAARRKAFAGQLLDAVMLISNSLKSGYSFLQSIDLVARELPPPISEEFRKVLHEIKYGVTFDDAVAQLITRMESDDLDLIMTCVMIQRQVGGNLAEVLDKIGFTIRERIRIKGQIRTLTAQGRLSGIILSLLPVALGLFLFMINPSYISLLLTRTIGQMLLGVALVNQVIGMMLIRKIVDIKV